MVFRTLYSVVMVAGTTALQEHIVLVGTMAMTTGLTDLIAQNSVNNNTLNSKQYMKREIKFRAWDDGVMYHTDDYANENNYGEYDHLYFFFQQIRGDAKLMQFTGLTDKNGKEVYEGDILKFNGNTNTYTSFVVWGTDGWRFNSYMPLGTLNLYPYLASPPTHYQKAEVIGNIYEHPISLNQFKTPH